jgi:hypothetical protein
MRASVFAGASRISWFKMVWNFSLPSCCSLSNAICLILSSAGPHSYFNCLIGLTAFSGAARHFLWAAAIGVYKCRIHFDPTTVRCLQLIAREFLQLIARRLSDPSLEAASKQALSHRVRYHMRGNAEGSTLRLSFGCILADQLGIELRRVGSTEIGSRFLWVNNVYRSG